jgi:outer membrane protein assembly factor BamA
VTSFQVGTAENTTASVIGVEALYTSKNIATLQARHNIFLPNNVLNFQGNWQLSRFGIVDFGIGAGNARNGGETFNLDEFPTVIGDSAFPIAFNYFRLQEKVFLQVAPHFFVGGGISINLHSKITDEKLSPTFSTPHFLYSVRNNYSPSAYNANGILFSLQYATREHPIRSYGGVYAELTLGSNTRWLGSTHRATQLQYDFRKYWSLSKQRPDKVLAVWHWASYMLSGSVPYLDLPGTGSDAYYRMGRGYTISRVKGPSYAYFETEYRFPITANHLLSGVCFVNLQTASDDLGKKIFQYWEPAAGTGLRILFQKQSRSTICIDFAKGRGSSGIFFGLNEAF